MERKIGEVFELDGVKLRVEKDVDGCVGCYLECVSKIARCGEGEEIEGYCLYSDRQDKQNVIFTEVKESLCKE